MSREEVEYHSLREAFAALAAVAGDGSRCPQPERLWASAREELAGSENDEVVLHLGECTACATAWRLARELSLPEAAQPRESTSADPGPARSLWNWVPMAAAAALVVGVGVLLVARWSPWNTQPPVYRSQEGRWLETLVPAGSSLPRGAFVLRWTAGPEGTIYDLRVTSEKLEPLARASGLERAQHQVPEGALTPLGAGQRIFWQVTAYLPDGRRVVSRTFVVGLQ
jgi:hypothetical protein